MKNNPLIIKSVGIDYPEDGFTNTKIANSSYVKVLAIKCITSKTVQDIMNELIEYALQNTYVEKADGTKVTAADAINLIV